jgi:ParB family transcriptional regulator, chromosome partitioning protein
MRALVRLRPTHGRLANGIRADCRCVGALSKMEKALAALKGLPWTTFSEMEGDSKVLTKIEEAEELLKSLRKALKSR